MKIAVFTDVFLNASGGIVSSIRTQKKELERLGHRVVVFCPGEKKMIKNEKDVIIVPTIKGVKVAGAAIARSVESVEKFALKWIKEQDISFDVVHIHYEGACSIAGVLVGKKKNWPIVQTMHGREDMAVEMNILLGLKTITANTLNQLHKIGMRKIENFDKVNPSDLAPSKARQMMWRLMIRQANAGDLVLAPTNHFREKLKKMGVIKPIEVLSNGVPDEMAVFNLRKLTSGEKLKIIWTSRLSKEKRFIAFLKAVKKSKVPAELEVFGNGNELLRAKILVKQLGLEVNFHGKVAQKEVLERIKTGHLTVVMSYGFDTQGLVILEAGAMGLPVLYCDPDMDEVCLKGAGLRAKDKSIEAMAELIRLVYENPEIVEKMSLEARKNREKVLQSVQIEKLVKYYEKLVNNR